MVAQNTTVRVLVLPVFKRYYLWHAWKEAPVSSTPPKPWREGDSLQEKLKLLLGSVQRWGSKQGEQQWHKLTTAPAGTFNHRLFRLAQDVLSRVDPNESFLRVLTQQADALEFKYPSSVPERLVRRRLRLLAHKARPFHASRLRLWILALVPQIPLIPLPLPNVTIYFTIWRIISNRSAGQGAAALWDALERLSDMQRLKLAQQLVALQQQQHVQLKPHSWAAKLAADADRLQRKCQEDMQTAASSSSAAEHGPQVQLQQQQQQQQQYKPPQGDTQQQQQHWQKGLPLPVFIADKELDKLVQPHERLLHFLPESTADKLVELYHQPHLLEHYKAARKACQANSKPPY